MAEIAYLGAEHIQLSEYGDKTCYGRRRICGDDRRSGARGVACTGCKQQSGGSDHI